MNKLQKQTDEAGDEQRDRNEERNTEIWESIQRNEHAHEYRGGNELKNERVK